MSNPYASPSARAFATSFAKFAPKTRYLPSEDHPILEYRVRKSPLIQRDFWRLYQNEILRNEVGLSPQELRVAKP